MTPEGIGLPSIREREDRDEVVWARQGVNSELHERGRVLLERLRQQRLLPWLLGHGPPSARPSPSTAWPAAARLCFHSPCSQRPSPDRIEATYIASVFASSPVRRLKKGENGLESFPIFRCKTCDSYEVSHNILGHRLVP